MQVRRIGRLVEGLEESDGGVRRRDCLFDLKLVISRKAPVVLSILLLIT